ncbi:MBL fold metallo-hydrolase [Pseudoduganella sp. DS3]|uniref:MBL fold metallo-hydrolase n=1 Tax=Pseudoduganella guangdongensis TaxID=2692179 RepID=A0A6N9HN94_9BURK|nr:MBL fold metallo-hydrolase [Pseudoduganella guangdongensis]MYN04879.1 MBL fold metallo-hydrolase [Pseudoduganella guangdongensis]
MKFKFWGVRGSIPSPGPRTVRYGGNTTCIEVRTDNDTLLIIDAGTGIFPLAQALVAAPQRPIEANILITHSHWDHIHGLPFFSPLFVRGSKVCLYGAADSETGKGIEHVMGVQLQYSYFPVGEAEMSATLSARTLQVGESVLVGDATVRNTVMSHPVTNLGYRIDCNGKSLFFSGDYEPPASPSSGSAAVDELVRGVDALVIDCSYTREEYPSKIGWGHGTFDSAIAMALRCGARRLLCTHHEPTRGDDELEAVFADVMARHAGALGGLEVRLAYEGLEVTL